MVSSETRKMVTKLSGVTAQLALHEAQTQFEEDVVSAVKLIADIIDDLIIPA